MSAEGTSAQAGSAEVLTRDAQGVYATLFDKINLNPVTSLAGIEHFQNADALSEASADERVTAAVSVFLDLLKQSSQKIERLNKTLLDEHIAALDAQISRQLDAVMHHTDFQRVESTWRGVKSLIDQTDFRRNVRIELLDISKDHLIQDFEDAPEIAQSGLYVHTYTQEYDTPGGEPIAAAISNYEFGRGPQDIALLRNISKVAAAAHMPFIGSVGPSFFGKESMEEVAAIIAHYLKLIQRENIGTTKDRRVLELELNNWIRGLVTEMTDPSDDLQASHPLRDAKVIVEDIDDNPGFFRVKLYAVPHFQVEGMAARLVAGRQRTPALATPAGGSAGEPVAARMRCRLAAAQPRRSAARTAAAAARRAVAGTPGSTTARRAERTAANSP